MKKRLLRILVLCSFVICIGIFRHTDKVCAESTPGEYSGYEYVHVSDIKSLQNALNDARDHATTDKPYYIKLEKGEYSISSTIRIFSNTVLDLSDCRIRRTVACNMLCVGLNDAVDSGVTGYYYKNITVIGGIFDGNELTSTVMKTAHADTVMFKGCTFTNSFDAHLIETAGVLNLTFDNCTFSMQKLSTNSLGLLSGTIERNAGDIVCYEALQLDILTSDHMRGYRCEALTTENVLIKDCTFDSVPRGVGSHTGILNRPMKNIEITGCKFTNIYGAAIQGFNWNDVKITNNYIDGVGRGITLYSTYENLKATYTSEELNREGNLPASDISTNYIESTSTNSNVTISNNTIHNVANSIYDPYESVAIRVYGVDFSNTKINLPVGNYYYSNVTIESNTLSQINGQGVWFDDVKNSSVKGNTITFSGSAVGNIYGVVVRSNSENNEIANNQISYAPANGIYVYNNDKTRTSVTNIYNNSIIAPKKYGIGIEKAKITTIQKNVIASTANNGININASIVTNIKENTVSNSKKNGIYTTASTLTNILSNNISKPASAGIHIANNSTTSSITSNTITSAKKYGIEIEKSKVTNQIYKNSISKSASTGILIYNCGTTKVAVKKINSNKITSPGNYAIGLEASKVSNIDSNSISSSANNGIHLNKKSVASTISGNKISTPKNNGIYVKASTVTTIKSNSIAKAKINAIFATGGTKVTNINNNAISTAGRYGVGIDKAKVVNIKGNSISKTKNYAINVYNKSTVTSILSNKAKSYKKSKNKYSKAVYVASNSKVKKIK